MYGRSAKGEVTSISKLIEGNRRFYKNKMKHPHSGKERILEVANKQHPCAVILCCSDSRVVPELIFDQGLGDLFVIRMVGNVIDEMEIGSIEYAIEHLNVRLIVIKGHQHCGAIQAYLSHDEVPSHIKDIIDSIKNESEIKNLSSAGSNDTDLFIKANIIHGVRQLKSQNPLIRDSLKNSQFCVIGAVYNMSDGKVTFIK